jgi:hypothetical protein
VYEHLGYQHSRKEQLPVASAPSASYAEATYRNVDMSITTVPDTQQKMPMVSFQRASTAGDEQPYEEEVLHMLHFFLCQLRAQCEKILGEEVTRRFDAEMQRLDPKIGSQDIIAAQVKLWRSFSLHSFLPYNTFVFRAPSLAALHGQVLRL